MTLHSLSFIHVHGSSTGLFLSISTTLMARHSSLTPSCLLPTSTSCPWILCYISAAAVLSRKTSPSQTAPGSSPGSPRVRNVLHGIVKVVQTEEYQYQDPVTAFLPELYVEFDFGAAQKTLKVAIDVVGNDCFGENSRTTCWIMRGI